MEPMKRKRKLNEIDKNIPFFPSSVTHLCATEEDGGKFGGKEKQQVKITPSEGCENTVHSLSKDVEEFENTQFQRSSGRKINTINKIEGRNHMKSCDRRYRKSVLQNDKADCSKVDLSIDVIQPKQLNISDLSDYKITVEDQNEKKNLKLVNEIDEREIKLWFNCDYFEDILDYELRKEKQHKLSEDFCKKYDVDPIRREILIDWLISVQIHLKANNNTLHLAVSLLDILLDRIYIPRKFLQVSAIAAFWVAYKFIHGNLSVKTLIGLCAGIPTRDMILDQEILVLETSRLLQAGGDMSTFFNYLLYKLFGHSFPPEIYYSGQYFLEIMLIKFTFTNFSACQKAITAVYAALTIFDSTLRFRLLEFTHFISKKTLRLMCRHLIRFLRIMYSDEEGLKSSCLYRKYKSSRYFRISTHEILKELSIVKPNNYDF